jgi:hypothetical protein
MLRRLLLKVCRSLKEKLIYQFCAIIKVSYGKQPNSTRHLQAF